jgi:hypothetical protein
VVVVVVAAAADDEEKMCQPVVSSIPCCNLLPTLQGI